MSQRRCHRISTKFSNADAGPERDRRWRVGVVVAETHLTIFARELASPK